MGPRHLGPTGGAFLSPASLVRHARRYAPTRHGLLGWSTSAQNARSVAVQTSHRIAVLGPSCRVDIRVRYAKVRPARSGGCEAASAFRGGCRDSPVRAREEP